MSDIEIRTARHEDAAGVLDLWRQADAAPTVTDDAAAVLGLIDHDPDALIVATLRGAVVGTLIATWDGWRGNMYRLAVHPDHRRRRIASRLVSEGESRLRAKGCRRVTALVLREEDQAVRLWSEVGYEQQPEMARFRRNLD